MAHAPRGPLAALEQVNNLQQAHTKMLMRIAKEIETLRKETKADLLVLRTKLDALIASLEE